VEDKLNSLYKEFHNKNLNVHVDMKEEEVFVDYEMMDLLDYMLNDLD
jgi:hypothetical protein